MQNYTAVNNNCLLFSDLKLYVVISILVISTIFFPALLHNFGITGQIFLPLYFFSLLGGITYGWRCGLMIGLLGPLISFSTSGMPTLSILPFVAIKALSIGTIGGFLIEKYKNKNIFLMTLISVLLTQIIGSILIFIITSNLKMAFMDITIGYYGLFLQIFLAPFLSQIVTNYENKIS